ncbi:hypothetical protein BC941DRAFT_512105 [Chlamydoabsidia padenii]|nr:hypothetical protein BC941DRAFT_512105 [Chlamydoabsidia padenii]
MNETDDIDEVADFSTLLNKSRKRGEGKAPKRGSKSFAPDHSSTQQTALEESRGALWDLIGEIKPLTGQHSMGILCSNTWSTTITQKKGTYYQYVGHTNQGNMTLYLEEAAWLLNRHALSVSSDSDTASVTFEDYCSLMFDSADDWITFEKYQVYAYLKRLGYNVQRTAFHTIDKRSSWFDFFTRCYQRIKRFIHIMITSLSTLSTRPLVTHYQCKSYVDVFSSLRTISFDPWHHGSSYLGTTPSYYPYTITWDVYKPNPKWKKRDPGVPDFRVVVGKMNDPLPSPDNLNYLFTLLYGLPHKDNVYHPIRNTRSIQSQPALLMGLVGDSEGVTFIRLQSDGISDITLSFK